MLWIQVFYESFMILFFNKNLFTLFVIYVKIMISVVKVSQA